jgi:hypothetical protein
MALCVLCYQQFEAKDDGWCPGCRKNLPPFMRVENLYPQLSQPPEVIARIRAARRREIGEDRPTPDELNPVPRAVENVARTLPAVAAYNDWLAKRRRDGVK